MAITAALVKELRERTSAGMMECKKFLVQTDGDIEKAIELMRKEGVMKAAKREGKITAEGIVIVLTSADKRQAVIVEINSETDFVSRSDDFKQFANLVASTALTNKVDNVEALLATKISHSEAATLEELRQQLISKIGENINVRRVHLISAQGIIGQYSHGERIGVLVDVKGANEDIAKDIAMHIAASNPVVVSPEEVSPELVAKEKEIYIAQAADSGKPADIIEKMVGGRIKKFLDEVSLLGQPFVKDPSITVAALLKNSKGEVASFVRYEVGEGIEKQQVDFAKEVMEQVQGS